MKLKGQRFERVSDIQRESQAGLDSIEEKGLYVLLKRGKNNAIAVYLPRRLL
jgi:hypothetical protein